MLTLTQLIVTAALAAETPVEPTAGSYVVGPHDVIEVTVYLEPDLSRVVVVGEDGDIFLPLLEEVHVAGLTAAGISDLLDERYVNGQFLVHPHTSVRVQEHLSQQVEVIGGVTKPGLYYLDGPTTLSQIVARAGWLDAESASGQATIRHSDGSTEVIDLLSLMRTGEGNRPLQPGDRVSVGEGQLVFVNGQVGKPGKYAYQKGLTVLQALSLAGDASQVARLSGAFLLRDGEKIPVNLKRIRRGRDGDVPLEPGDTLYVPESPI